MSALVDRTGQVHGRLTVISRAGSDRWKQAQWLCQCDCGNTVVVRAHDLVRQNTASCGCLQIDSVKNTGYGNTTHGHSRIGTRATDRRSPTYVTWCNMKSRCLYPLDDSYKYYGARGITICDRWLESFDNFLADMGERPEGLTIDRIDPDGNYEPGNCRWATAQEQARNRSQSAKTEKVSAPENLEG